jgi:hypothetical protein
VPTSSSYNESLKAKQRNSSLYEMQQQKTGTMSSAQKQTATINKIEKLFKMLEGEHSPQKTEIGGVESKYNLFEQELSAGETEVSNENYQLESEVEEEDQHPENVEEQDTESNAEEGSVQSKIAQNPNKKFINELANAKSLITTLIQDKISELEIGVVPFGDMSCGDTRIAANLMAGQSMHVCKSSDEIRHLKIMRKQCLEKMASLVDRMSQLDTSMEKCEKCSINYQ